MLQIVDGTLGGLEAGLTLDYCHAVDILPWIVRVGADVDANEATRDGVFEAGVEAHLSKAASANADSLDIPQLGKGNLAYLGRPRPALGASPLYVAIAVVVAIGAASVRGRVLLTTIVLALSLLHTAIAFLAGPAQAVYARARLADFGSADLGPNAGRLPLAVLQLGRASLAFLVLVLVYDQLAQHAVLANALVLLTTLGKDLFALDLTHVHDLLFLGVAEEEALNRVLRRLVLISTGN